MLPSASVTASATTTNRLSRLIPTAHAPAVYASRAPSPAPPQDLLPPADLLLGRSGLSPAGCSPKFLVSPPSSPARLPWRTTDIYRASFELCVRVREAKIRHAELRDQAERASVSAFLAVSEGLPHTSAGMRKQYFARARASVWEAAGAIHLAVGIGAMDQEVWRECQALALRASAMLVAMLR